MNTTSKVFGGLLIGAIIGAVAGVFMAPASGKKTLKSIGKKSKGYKKMVAEAVNCYLDDIRQGYNKKVDLVAKNGKNTIDSLKDGVKL